MTGLTASAEGAALAGAAAAVAFAATGLARAAARRAKAFDVPSVRRMHRVPTPRVGGLGILAGWVAAGAVRVAWRSPPAVGGSEAALWLGGLLFFGVGFLDDARRGVPVGLKFALQAGAGACAVAMGLRWTGQGLGPFGPVALGAATPILSVLWLVAVVNVVNFLDGIDLIAAATAVVVLGGAAGGAGADVGALYAAAAGAVVGFSLWNAPPASIFMGDGGSHLLGFLLAAAALGPADAGGAGPSAAAPWPVVAAPLLPAVVDVAEALVHKVRRGIPLGQAHDDHLYQRLVKAGATPLAVALRYAGLSLAALVLVGPVAQRAGLAPALALGAAVLGAHLWTGGRRVRGVPRLGAP